MPTDQIKQMPFIPLRKDTCNWKTDFFWYHGAESKTFGLANYLLRLACWKNLELRLSGLLINEKEKTIPSNTGIQSSEAGLN